MAAPDQQMRLLDADRDALERLRVQVVGHAGDDEIEPRSEQFACENIGVVDADFDFEIGRRRAHPRHGGRDEIDRRPGDCAERDDAAPPGSQIGDLALRLGKQQQHRAGVTRERLAERRQPDAARQPLAQRPVRAAPRSPGSCARRRVATCRPLARRR